MIEIWLSGRTALFWAMPRGRGHVPRSWTCWALAGRCQHARSSGVAAALVLVLHCINTYKDGCSASEARQAVGGGRGAVVRGTPSQRPSTGSHCGWVACPRRTRFARCVRAYRRTREMGGLVTPATKAITGEERMNQKDKPTPIASLPRNWSAFNDHEVLPWPMCGADAAAVLRRARNLRARGQATISVEAVGRYRLSTFNTLILQTRRC